MSAQRKQPALDLLRLLAALMVLAVHTGQAAGLDAWTRTGAYGVELFFILSGYLSGCSLERSADPLRYYRRRAVRILPTYWLLLVLRWSADALRGIPCGVRYLRYFVFLQMLLPSENYTLWNNRGALWTMSAFALFYLLAPWLHRLLRGFWPSMAALAALLVCKGMLGGWIESAMAGFPPQAMADQFAAKTPLMVLHCFLFGTTLRCALREEKTLWFGVFCALLPVATDFRRGAVECVLALLVLAAVQTPAPRMPERAAKAVSFLSAGSFWLYLLHPLLLDLVPGWQGLPGMLALAALCVMISYGTYGLVVRPLEQAAARKFA